MLYKIWSGKHPYFIVYSDQSTERLAIEFAVEDLTNIPMSHFKYFWYKAKPLLVLWKNKPYIRLILKSAHNIFPELADPGFEIPVKEGEQND